MQKIFLLPNGLAYFNEDYLSPEQKAIAKMVEVEIPQDLKGFEKVLKMDYDLGTAEYVLEKSPETEAEMMQREIEDLKTQNLRLTETLDMVLTDLIPSLLEGGEPV